MNENSSTHYFGPHHIPHVVGDIAHQIGTTCCLHAPGFSCLTTSNSYNHRCCSAISLPRLRADLELIVEAKKVLGIQENTNNNSWELLILPPSHTMKLWRPFSNNLLNFTLGTRWYFNSPILDVYETKD